MPNLLSNLRECFGFSQIMKSTFSKVFCALRLKSSRFPIGVDTIYKPFSISFIFFLLIFIISCSPQNYIFKPVDDKKSTNKTEINKNQENKDNNIIDLSKNNKEIKENKHYLLYPNKRINSEIEVLLPKINNQDVTNDFIKAFELSLYKKNIKKIKININLYSNKENLNELILEKAKPGKIFIGPLTSSDTKDIEKFCSLGIIFFSFASDRDYGNNCIYLINFFPEDDLNALFNSFESNSKIALLYPENHYGYYINSIIDLIATKSNSIIVNRASYKTDLSNAREAIKELSNYELRKYELERQKTILRSKKDEVSKKALKKIERFETSGIVDFTHLILPEYNIRLLQIAPLLPFYDIDPNKIQFVGTGVWDNKIFFDEPSLQGSIFPGVTQNKRIEYINDFFAKYNQEPSRTITIPYDLIGLIEYLISKQLDLLNTYKLLNEENINFEGMDGKFSFRKNVISRELEILKISDGKAILLK